MSPITPIITWHARLVLARFSENQRYLSSHLRYARSPTQQTSSLEELFQCHPKEAAALYDSFD